jgi:mannose-1-phosphate guanylyltransferase/mannose-6-phosphate isomerase
LPKQFVELIGTTLFDRAVHRLDGLKDVSKPIIVSGEGYLPALEAALSESGVEAARIVAEPVGRNTGPAVLAAALGAEPDDVLVVLPSDHLVTNRSRFVVDVGIAVGVAQRGYLVTFGVVPEGPETGYGYIEPGPKIAEGVFGVSRFHEKPDREDAARYVSGGALWNSGMFVFAVSTLLAQASQHIPELLRSVEATLTEPVGGVLRLDPSFADLESISIDNALMERTSKAAVVPIDVGWSDVGSYSMLLAASDTDDDGNALIGDVNAQNVRNSYVHATSRRVSVAEVDGVVVVETPDDVLVVPVAHSQAVRALVEMIADESEH